MTHDARASGGVGELLDQGCSSVEHGKDAVSPGVREPDHGPREPGGAVALDDLGVVRTTEHPELDAVGIAAGRLGGGAELPHPLEHVAAPVDRHPAVAVLDDV